MTIVYLVRHGQASAGTDNYDRLSMLGRKQSTLLGEHWARLSIKPNAAYAGSLERQKDTASLVLAGSDHALTVQALHDLDEYNHTIVDQLFGFGKRSDAVGGLTFSDYHQLMERWRDSDHHTIEDYESWQTFENRGAAAIKAICQQSNHDSIAFFTSGGVVSTILQQVLGFDFTHTLQAIWQTRNSSVTTLKFENEKLALINYNTVSHLEYHADHSLITLI
jgi:broad specificity phosphatase PhoE